MNKSVAIILGILLLSGCTLFPKPGKRPALYNFVDIVGSHIPEQAQQSGLETRKNGKKILVAQVIAPLWLDTQAIHYRLAYHNASQTYTYADSRWTAPPAFLLTQQIKQKIAVDTAHLVIQDSNVAKAEFELHIELEDFFQNFETLTDSHVWVRFRASLINNKHRLIAQKSFNASQSSPTANAAGAVKAFSITSDQLTDDLVRWLNDELENLQRTIVL
ncbi:cholesterol transport system auxiliary component [Nitrosomonas aestuarii]|uniref:Cholesterol transport system auxiliary component n=1 Tax=Nitrosomonas aestuarii TaxID=52441 RepID=A0A1I4CWG2_9PROT|nr:ABC-type transport auxiliary lipoprotein family protein [Nitrosomonas aestuarii]SFK84689.1 cholesterol transport system auxiliary component [Nitrosomonas aestuarii]